jgi:hypothetical protein
VEPISAAIAAFSAIKAGVSAGKEITSLAKDVGTLFDGIDAAKHQHSQKRSRSLSANEEAMSTFIAKQKAQDLERDLRELVVTTRGISAWHELIRLRVEIKRKRKEEELRLKKEREERIKGIALISGLATLTACLFGFLYYLVQMKMDGRL